MRFARPLLPVLVAALVACSAMPPAQTLELGAQRLSYTRAGPPGRSPVAVFQSGLGDGQSVWADVIGRVAPEVAVFAYDRPGYGQSGNVPTAASAPPRDPCTTARELHALLRATGVAPPYVLVGHSIGGLYQYAFARLYPGEVAAVLLLDPTHPEHWARMQGEAPAAARLVGGLRATVFAPAMQAEFDAQARPECLAELRTAAPPAVPVRLLVRSSFGLGEGEAFQGLVRRLEGEWPALLPGATRRQVERSGHYIQKDRPDVVADELRALARAATRS